MCGHFKCDHIWRNFTTLVTCKNLVKHFECLLNTWETFEPSMVNIFACHWANSHFYKCPNTEETIFISGHTDHSPYPSKKQLRDNPIFFQFNFLKFLFVYFSTGSSSSSSLSSLSQHKLFFALAQQSLQKYFLVTERCFAAFQWTDSQIKRQQIGFNAGLKIE